MATSFDPEPTSSFLKFDDWLRRPETSTKFDTLRVDSLLGKSAPAEDYYRPVKEYSNYVRQSLLSSNKYSGVDSENEIRQGMANILDYYGAVEETETDEDRKKALDKTGIFMDDELDTETLIGLARKSGNLTKEESDILSEYTAFKDVLKERDEAVSYEYSELKKEGFADGVEDKYNILKAEAEKIVANPLFQNKVKRDLVSQGDYSMAEVYREQDGKVVLGNDGQPIKDLFFPRSVPQEQINAEINKAYSSGLLNAGTAKDAFAYASPMEEFKVNGVGVNRGDVIRSAELGGVIAQTLIDKPYLQNSFDKLKEKLAGDQYLKDDEDKTLVENILSPIDAVNDLYYESQASKRSKQDVDEVYEWVAFNLNRSGILDSGDSVTIEEIKPIVDKLALNQAYNDGTVRFSEIDETNPKKVASNIGVAPDGTVIVHPLLNKSDFEAALEAKKDELTTVQVDQARATREEMLIQRAPETAKLLASQMGDKFIKFQADALDSGKSQKDAVEEFLDNRDNFSEFKTRAAGIGASIGDSVVGALATIPALMGNEKARDYFINYSKKQQERSSVANLFGVEFGIGQDIAQGIAPVIVDGLVTLGLSSTTGVGGAAYLAARAGTKMTVKGLMTAALGKGLRETAEMSAEKLLMKESLEGAFRKSVSPEEAIGLIKQYNTAINSSWVKSPIYFLPTANRVAGMSYSSTYATLSEMKKPDGSPMYTPEEVRKGALSSSLITAGASALITSAFSVLGKAGGVEELFMAGANKKQMLSAINQFADTSGITAKINGRITEKSFKEITAKRLKETIKENGLNGIASQSRLMAGVAGGVKMGVEEFPEEALDQFVSGIIETSFTGEDKPLFDRMAEAMHAGLVGLAIGGGLGGIKATGNQFSKGSQRATQLAQRQIETDFVNKVTSDLRNSGSPITADIVDAIMRKSSGRTGIRVGDKTVSAGDLLAATLNQPTGPTPTPAAAATPTPAAAATPTPASGRQTRRKAATKPTVPEATVEQAGEILKAIAEHPDNFAGKVVATGTDDIPQAKTFNNQKLNQKKVAAAVEQGQKTPSKPKEVEGAKPRGNVVKKSGVDEKAVAERITETTPKPPKKVTKQQVKQETESPSDNSNTNTVVDEDEVVDAADAAVEVEITQDKLNDLQILWGDVNSIIENFRGSELDPDDVGDILAISTNINEIFPGIPEDIASIPTDPKELFDWVVDFDIWLGQQKTQVEVAAAPAAEPTPTETQERKVPQRLRPSRVVSPKPGDVAPAAEPTPTETQERKVPQRLRPSRVVSPKPGDVVDESGKVVEPTLDEQIGDFLVDNSLVSKEEDFDVSIAAIKKVVIEGYPVTFSRNSQYGLQGFSFAKGNSKKLTSFVHELIDQQYPKRPLPDDRTGFTTKVLKDGKNKRTVYFQDDIPFFDNDPVTVRILIANGHPVFIPSMFWGVLNNAIKRGTYSGVSHAIKVLRLKTSGTESEVVATTLKTVPVGLAHYDSKTAEYWRGVFDLFWTKESSSESVESEISEERVRLFYTGMVDSTSIETYLSKSIAYVQGKRMPNASNFLVVDGDPRLFTQAQNEILQEAHGRAAQALVRSKLKNSVTKKDNKWVINNGAVTTFKKFLTSIGKNPNEVADRLRTLLNETSPKNDKIFEKYISSLFKGLNSAGLTDTDSIDKISDRVIRRTLQFIDTKKIREAASLSTSLDNFYSFGDAPVDTVGEGGDLTRMSFEDYYSERREFTAGGPLPGEEDVFDEILNFSPIFVESGTLGLGVQAIEEPNYIRLNTPTGGPTQPVDYGRGRVYAVSGIVDGSPAAGALNFGDIIVEIDGTPTANIYAYDIPDKLTFGTPGAEVKLQVIRFDSETNSFASGSVPVVLKRATQSAVSKENTPQGTSDYSNLGYKEINGVLDGISNVVRKTVDTFPDLKTGLIDVYRAFAQTDETYEQLRDRTADEILGASMNIYSALGSDKTISDYLLYSDDNPVTDEALRAAAFLKSLRGPDESLPKHLLLFRNYLRVLYNFQSKYADAPLTDYEQALLIKPVKELFAEEGMQLNEDNFNSIVKVLSNRLGNVFGARMQERLAKNFARTKEQRDAAEARNTEEANDLGLANGDPESVITALNRIVADNDYPLYLRTTARALLRSPDLIRSTKINIFSNNFDFAGKFGTDINGNYVVSLNLRGSNGKSLASVLTHEYLHALTHNALNDPRFANNAKVTELKRTYEELKNLVDEKGLDDPELLAGMESVDEFVAYMFTSQSFQNAVKRVGFSESKGFFKRILDTILDIFGIRAALRQSEIYTQMVDLVYYAPNTEPLTMGRLNSDLAQSVAEAAAEAAENATAVGNMTRPGTVIPVSNAQATPVVAGDPNLVQDPRDTERQKELARTVVARIRNLGSIPAEVPVVVDYNLPQAMGADIETGRIIINPEKVAVDFISPTQDDAEVDAALEIALDEELTHVADLTTIPQEEFDKFANLVPDSDLEEAGVKYFNDPTYTLPDPATDPDKYTTERNLLVSERLRQNVQGILLGQSTEDMFLFLSRNKANKEVTNFAEAYFKRVVAGYTMKRKLRKFSARERALLTRLINERRRLALNYRSPNPHLIAGLSGEALVNEVDKFLAQHESKVNPNPPEQEKPAEDPTKFDQQNNRYTMEDETFVQPADNTKLSGAFRTSFNLPLLTDKVKEMGNLLSNGRADEAYAMAETAVAHMLSDIPTAKYTFKVQRIRGAWEDQSQASLAMTFGTDSEETLVAIRNRMNALGLAFNQDEIHELEVLAPLPEGADYEIGVIDSDGSRVQPMITVKLKESVPGAAIETYRRTSGVRGMSYDEGKKELLLYNLDDDPALFVQNTKSIVTSIRNDFPATKPTYRTSNVRIRRSGNATDEGRGIFAYEENYVPDSNAYGRDSADEFFAARNAFVRSILNTTGGRLTSPISGPQMAVYKKIALTAENISKLYDTATDFDNLPLDGSSNPMVLKAYEALVKDLDRAYKSIVNKKLKIQLTDSKPYGSQADLMADLTAGVLKIQRTNANSFTTPDIAAKHPLLRNSNYTGMLIGADGTDTVEATLLNNDMLRVLQTFATYGVSGPVSQEGSFQFMAAMLRQPEAVWALSGEIRGQHAWHTYGPDARGANGDMLRPNEVGYIREPNRRWSEQKLALLPIKDADTGNSVIDDKLRKFAKSLSESEKNGSLDQQPAPAPTPTNATTTPTQTDAKFPTSPEGVAYPKADRGSYAVISTNSKDIINEVNKLPGLQEKLTWLYDNGFIQKIGKDLIVDHFHRVMVLARVGNVNVPFYVSTGMAGKKNVEPGKWYAVWGLGPDSGWINKGDEKSIVNQYNYPVLQKIAKILNESLGGKFSSSDVNMLEDVADLNSVMNLGITPVDLPGDPVFWPNAVTALTAINAESRVLHEQSLKAPAPTPTVLGMAYIGPRAELNQFKRDSLQTAQMMAASGKSSEEIRTTTGWSPNPYDGKLRWEIPDNDAGFVGLEQYREVTNRVYNAEVFRRLPIEYAAEQIKAGKFVRLSEVFNHPAIYEAYPDAANIAFFPLGGNVAQGSIRTLSGETMITASVVLDNDRISDESTSTIIHELQHFIQDREGFTPGGSPDTLITTGDLAKVSEFARAYGKILSYEKDIARQVDAIAEERSKKGFLGIGGPSSKEIKLREEIISGIQKSVNEYWQGLNNGLGIEKDSVRAAIFKAFVRVENELGSVWYLNNRSKGLHMVYRLLAGEVEARDVEARRTFTPEQRAATAPYSSENISPEDAIILPPTVLPAPSASRFAQDAEYLALAADPVKNQARLQEMVDGAADISEYSESGARSGFYVRGGIPMLPSSSANLGTGYYAVLNGKAEDVAPYASQPVARDAREANANRITGNVRIKLGRVLRLKHPTGADGYIKRQGLEEQFQAWLNLQGTINTAYRNIGGRRPQTIADMRGSGISLDQEGKVDIQDSGKAMSFLFDTGRFDSVIVDWDEAAKIGMKSGDGRTGKEVAVANPNQIKSADPVTFDEQGKVIPLSQRFDTTKASILYAPSASRFGSSSGIPNAVAADTTDYSGFTELFTMPAFEVGTYKSPATYMGKVLKGSYDSRIRRLLNMNKSLERAGLDLMTRFKKRLDLIIKREFDGDPSSVISVLNRASGTTEATFSNDAWNAINDKYDKQIEETGTPTRPYDPVEYNDMVTALTMMNPTASATTIERMANRELYSMEINRIEATRTAEINAERKKIGDAVRADRDAAFMELRAISPNLAKAVADLRQIIDEISQKASKETGIKNQALSVIIEDNLGIYVTRAYKFFEDAGYADIIMRPDAQASSAVDPAVIDAADDYFRNEFLKQEVRRIRKSDLTLTKAEAEAEAEYRYRTSERKHGMSPAVAARIEFLSQYRPGGSSDRMAVNPDVIDVVDASLKRRGDIPQVLRDLLGERTGEDSVYNLIRTLGVVTRITASQAMVNTIRNIATTGPDKWVYGPDEIGTGDGQFLPGNLLAKGYREISNKLGGSPFSSLQGYYAPKEFVEAVEESASEASRRSAAAAAERGIQYALGITKYLTGTVMGFKTLWSVAHYGRNIIGQSMMAIHQGRPHLILASAKPLVEELTVVGSRVLPSAIRNALGGLTGDGIDISDEAFAKRLKLIGVGVLEDNVRTNTFRQLVAGQRTIDDVQDEMRMLFAQSNAFEKIKGKVTSVTARLAELEGATEDFMKVAVFRDTLSVLTKARDSGTGSFRGVEFSKMTDNDLDRLAADMTQDTMPAYSRTSPLIRAFTKSNAGDLVAPFIRYWSEMIRVTVTSPMLAVEEMRSGNPVMKMRGFQRMLGSVAAHSISVFAAEAITSWFSDLDDEEEETVREGEAPYLKNHSMAYYRENGVLFKLDFSFLNPLSVVGDPIKAAYDKAIKGDFYGAASAALMTSLEDTILNPQILFGAVKNALENRDSTTGDYLYIEGVDSDREALHKQVSYVVKKTAPTLALTALKIYEAYNATGDVEDEYSAEYALRQLIIPARPTPVDVERVMRNIMREKKDQLQQVEGSKYKLTTRKPLNIEYTREVYREQVEGIRGILSQIYKHGVNLGSLGVPNEILYGEIGETIGKADTDLLYAGFMRRPEMTQGLADSLLRSDRKGDYGVLRYNAYLEEVYKTPEYLSIK